MRARAFESWLNLALVKGAQHDWIHTCCQGVLSSAQWPSWCRICRWHESRRQSADIQLMGKEYMVYHTSENIFFRVIKIEVSAPWARHRGPQQQGSARRAPVPIERQCKSKWLREEEPKNMFSGQYVWQQTSLPASCWWSNSPNWGHISFYSLKETPGWKGGFASYDAVCNALLHQAYELSKINSIVYLLKKMNRERTKNHDVNDAIFLWQVPLTRKTLHHSINKCL